jgi:hypothetical protein
MRDLQRICIACGHKGRCRHDLAAGTAPSHYRDYCPNAMSLDVLFRSKRKRRDRSESVCHRHKSMANRSIAGPSAGFDFESVAACLRARVFSPSVASRHWLSRSQVSQVRPVPPRRLTGSNFHRPNRNSAG